MFKLETRTMTYKIDWAWLKNNTLPEQSGAIPGLGLLYKHLPATSIKCAQILVLDGDNCQRIIKRSNGRWSRPDQISGTAFYW
jgi:hypothetical protein